MATARALIRAVVCTIVSCAVGVLGPQGSAIALVALPLPALVLGGWFGVGLTAACCIVSGALIGAGLSVPAGAYYLALVGVPAVATVWALRAGCRIETTAGVAVASVIACGGALLWVSYGDSAAMLSGMAAGVRESFDLSLALYRDLGMSADRLAELELRREEVTSSLFETLPAAMVIASGVVWFFNILVSTRWTAWPQVQDLKRWQAPPWFIWLFIVAGFLMLAPLPPVAFVARNVFGVMMAFYFFQGLAIVSYYLQRLGLPRGLRVASYAVIALQQMVAGIVLVLGVFDLWGDFRRLSVQPVDASAGSDLD